MRYMGNEGIMDTNLLGQVDTYLIEHLLQDLVALFLFVFQAFVHDVVDCIRHHLLFHVHSSTLLLKLVHDALNLREIEATIHSTHRLRSIIRGLRV